MGWLCVGVCDGLCGEARILCGCKRQNTWSLNVLRVTGNPRDAATTDHFPGWEGGVCALGKKKKKSKKKGNRGGWDGVRALPVSSRARRRVSGRSSAATRGSLAARCASSALAGVGFLPRRRQRAFGGAFCSSTFKSGPQLGSRSLSSYHATCGIQGPPLAIRARPHVALLPASISDTPLPERQCAARGHSFGDSESE